MKRIERDRIKKIKEGTGSRKTKKGQGLKEKKPIKDIMKRLTIDSQLLGL